LRSAAFFNEDFNIGSSRMIPAVGWHRRPFVYYRLCWLKSLEDLDAAEPDSDAKAARLLPLRFPGGSFVQ
jgi:hypothetical protein